MRAFVLRISPVGVDGVPEALAANQISIGWPKAEGLTDPNLDYWRFRELVKEAYYADDPGYRDAGGVAGQLWRFIRDMAEGDLVVVPHGGEFFVAKVAGPLVYRSERAEEHSAFRRPVEWLNGAQPIPRARGLAALQSRMKIRQTCADATDLIEEIQDALNVAGGGEERNFSIDLRSRLIDQARREITSGRMDSFGFERLLATLLRSLSATEVRIVPRSQDKGADIVATFSLAGTFSFRLAVQAKHYRADPPVGARVVDQLVSGMEAEQASLGWIATSGSFSPEAIDRKAQVEEERGFQIELIDGDQLAAMIVEGGLHAVGMHSPGGAAAHDQVASSQAT
ncbi:MAG: restriction endonuclease [Chloroflexota bacterium]|nr:restriction endonuclease [Chloroflexota bacterium]